MDEKPMEEKSMEQKVLDALERYKVKPDGETQAEEKPAEAEPAMKPAPVPCPRCGFHEGSENKPATEDVQEYVRSIIAGRQFSKKYPLFDNRITVEMKTMSSREGDRVNTFIRVLKDSDELEVYDMVSKCKMLYMLSSVTAGGKVTTFKAPAADQELSREYVCSEFDARFGDMCEAVLTLLTRVLGLFGSLVRGVTTAGLDENFYKAAGPY